jgi:NAD(P)-dependent dehydrogenase (short-subunit alcohol dehydrogenase family)
MTLLPTGRPRLEGKVAIITGAGSSGPGVGTGKAASILFAREGARVLLVDRNPQAAEATLATIREEGGEASVLAADVTLAADCEAIAEAAVERYGGLNILFNNVGITGPGSPTDVEESVWDNVLDVNLKSM